MDSERLTASEFEALKLLADGFRIKDIAKRMHRRPRSVKRYLTCLSAKLHTENDQRKLRYVQLLTMWHDPLFQIGLKELGYI